MAPACHQLSRDSRSARSFLVAVFSRIRSGDDSNARAHWLALYQHSEPLIGTIHARHLHWLSRGLRPSACERRPGSRVVCALRNPSLDCRCRCGQKVWRFAAASADLSVRSDEGRRKRFREWASYAGNQGFQNPNRGNYWPEEVATSFCNSAEVELNKLRSTATSAIMP